MLDVQNQLVDCLLDIEAELRKLGWWAEVAPSVAELASTQPFCVDTLKFEQWLQWVCLPRMKQLLENGDPLPGKSAITEMAEVAYMEVAAETVELRKLLQRFDRLLGAASKES